MTEISDFGLIVLAVSATVFVALLGMRLADRFSLPYAAVILVGAVVISEAFTSLQDVLSIQVPAAYQTGDLDDAALREIVIFLSHYAGWPVGARLNSLVEETIARGRDDG